MRHTTPLPVEPVVSVFMSDGVGLPGNQASESHLLPSCHQDFLLWCGASTFLAPPGQDVLGRGEGPFLCCFLAEDGTRPGCVGQAM